MITRIFEQIDAGKLMMLSLLVLLGSVGVSIAWGVRFDGVIDMHMGHAITWQVLLMDWIASWGLLCIALWALGRVFNKRVRWIDVWNVVGLARAPLVLLGLLQGIPGVRHYHQELLQLLQSGSLDLPQHLMIFVLLLGILSLAATILFVIILYRGFKIAAHVKTTKQTVWFFVVLFLTELFAKIFLMMFDSI
jgi:hypothetical protein